MDVREIKMLLFILYRISFNWNKTTMPLNMSQKEKKIWMHLYIKLLTLIDLPYIS